MNAAGIKLPCGCYGHYICKQFEKASNRDALRVPVVCPFCQNKRSAPVTIRSQMYVFTSVQRRLRKRRSSWISSLGKSRHSASAAHAASALKRAGSVFIPHHIPGANFLTFRAKSVDKKARKQYTVLTVRPWRNWQTRTFEGRMDNTVRVQVSVAAPASPQGELRNSSPNLGELFACKASLV